MIKCLRALPLAMAAEHSTSTDIVLTAPGELLSIPVHSCREQKNPNCQCRKVFVGIHSRQPTTLARVCEGDTETLLAEGMGGAMLSHSDDSESGSGVVLHGLEGVSYALRHFEVGALLRVNRTAGAVYLEDTWKSALRETVEL